MLQDSTAFPCERLPRLDSKPCMCQVFLQHAGQGQGQRQGQPQLKGDCVAQDVLVDIPMPPSRSGRMQDVRAPQRLTAAAVEAAWTGANSLAEPLLGAEGRRTGGKAEERPDEPQARS